MRPEVTLKLVDPLLAALRRIQTPNFVRLALLPSALAHSASLLSQRIVISRNRGPSIRLFSLFILRCTDDILGIPYRRYLCVAFTICNYCLTRFQALHRSSIWFSALKYTIAITFVPPHPNPPRSIVSAVEYFSFGLRSFTVHDISLSHISACILLSPFLYLHHKRDSPPPAASTQL